MPLAEAPLDPRGPPDTSQRPKAQQPRKGALLGLFGLALLVIGSVSVAVSGTTGPRPAPEALGGNLPVNAGATDLADINAHNSPTVVRNPVEANNVVVANRIDSPAFSCGLHLSFDGGASWASRALPVPAGEEPKCYAPDLAFGADGTLYVLFVTLQGEGNLPHAAWTVASADGGRALTEPRRALGPLAFQARLTADPGRAGQLYLTWLQARSTATLGFPESGYPVMAARSDDGGATWSAPRPVSGPSRLRVVAPSPATGPSGHLFVAYLDLGDDRLDYEGAHEGQGGDPYEGPWRLVLARSADGGATWAESVIDDGLVPRSGSWPSSRRLRRWRWTRRETGCTWPSTMPAWGIPTCGCGRRLTGGGPLAPPPG